MRPYLTEQKFPARLKINSYLVIVSQIFSRSVSLMSMLVNLYFYIVYFLGMVMYANEYETKEK